MLQHLHPVVQMVILAAGLVGACIYIYAAWKAAYSLRISIANVREFGQIRDFERRKRKYERAHNTTVDARLVIPSLRGKTYYGQAAAIVVFAVILVSLYFPVVYFFVHLIAPIYNDLSIESISHWKGRQIGKYIVFPLFVLIIILFPAWLGWSRQSVRITGFEGELEL